MHNVMVTGGAGYIGSHICKALAEKNYSPIVYDNLSRGNEWAVKWGPLEVGDICDTERVEQLLVKYSPMAVIHLAAYAYVGESVLDPLLYYQNNVTGSIGLLKPILSRKLPFVFSSSCATYGVPKIVPVTEDHPQSPINPYGHSKLIVERILGDLGNQGLPWISLRYFNAAGADPDGEIGESHNPETHLIPSVLIAALTGNPIRIFGSDYDTPDGTCIRDYVHVSDLADAHVRALDYLLNGGASRALNLANETGHSVREVIAAAERVSGRTIRVDIAPRRPGDPAILVGESSRARALLGWTARRSEIATQVRDAWRWLDAHRPNFI